MRETLAFSLSKLVHYRLVFTLREDCLGVCITVKEKDDFLGVVPIFPLLSFEPCPGRQRRMKSGVVIIPRNTLVLVTKNQVS